MAGWKLKAVIVTVVTLCALPVIFRRHSKCNLSSVITQLCSAYKEGYVSGPICSDLCEQNNIHLKKCLTTVPDKKIYDGEWHGTSVILKVNMSWFKEFEESQKITDSDAASSYQNDVSSRVNTLFGNCSQCNKLASLLLLLGDGDGDGSVTAAEARTFISLLQHVEPMMLMALNESKHTVDFYGYCGGLYMVEKVPFVASNVFHDSWELVDLAFLPEIFEPLQNLLNENIGSFLNAATFYMLHISTIFNDALTVTKHPVARTFFQVHVTSEREKFDFAYSLLDATLDVAVTRYGLTHSCDVHLGNYGITNKSTVKLIDLDLTYPHVFLRSLLEQKECVSDMDCFVGSSECCWSACDTMAGTCKSLLGLQDLHIICEVVFPRMFTRPNILDPIGYNTTCLVKAVKKLAEVCSKMPVAYSVRQLRHNILAVKKRLQSIELKYIETC
ncbi:hypothetical protein ACROYT_G006389 [Oculina patagonica]